VGRDAKRRANFDLLGAVTITAGLVALTYAIVGTEQHGWGSARTLAWAGAGLVLIAVFIADQARFATAPLMPLRIFSSRMLKGANVVVFCLGAVSFAMWYFVSLYLQQVLGYTPIEAGLAFLPMPVAIGICTRFASRWTGQYGPGPVLAFGMALIAAGMFGFSGVSADGSYVSDVLWPSIVTAGGIGFSFVPATIAATTGVMGPEAGLASGIVNTSRQIGGSLGLALLATIATQRSADVAGDVSAKVALTDGFQRAFLAGGIIGAIGVVSALALLVRGTVTPRREPSPARR
jgi:predicted MFS family arabinose efflux permease